MHVNADHISLGTLIGVSTMLGHRLEDRSAIRNSQQPSLRKVVDAYSTRRLSNRSQQHLFTVAPLDILASDVRGRKQFHLLEINGTGIGGFSNLPHDVMQSVLAGMSEFAEALTDPAPLVLVAISGKEDDSAPRLNKLVHEKVLYIEAIKQGFERDGSDVTVAAMPQVVSDPTCILSRKPTVVLGYIKDFVDNLTIDVDGRMRLFGRPVSAGVNDRFCLNAVEKFDHQVDLARFATMNRGFLAGGDKGVAYELLNDFLTENPHRCMPRRIQTERALCRDELIGVVLDWVRRGQKTVIKPQGTGLGHGIEFFLDRDESEKAIVSRIEQSMKTVSQYYHLAGGGFPYTVCEYVDACRIAKRNHPFHNRKYELRVVVYRDGMTLKAFPSIVKVASKVYNATQPARLSLINNITTSSQASCQDGTCHMLPLANRETLNLLGLKAENLIELCSFATSFIRDLLDRVQTEPGRFGLPTPAVAQEVEAPRLRLLQAA